MKNNMNRRDFLAIAGVAMAGTMLPGCTEALSSARDKISLKKPNFIIIFCDDLGYGDLGDVNRKGRNQRPAAWVVSPKPLLLSSK